MAKAKKLFTIGYEQTPSKAVLDELEQAGVKLLVDVRAVASLAPAGLLQERSSLRASTNAAFAYVHLRGLGTPKTGREAARSGQVCAAAQDLLGPPEDGAGQGRTRRARRRW